MKLKKLKRNNLILLICLLCLIFLYPLVPVTGSVFRDLMQTAIFFSGVFSLDFSNKSLKILLPLAVITTTTTWLEHFLQTEFTYLLDIVTTFFFLVAIVVLMTRHIARSRDVTPSIILSAINGYLLIGILGGALLAIANADFFYEPTHVHGISFPGENPPMMTDYILPAILPPAPSPKTIKLDPKTVDRYVGKYKTNLNFQNKKCSKQCFWQVFCYI